MPTVKIQPAKPLDPKLGLPWFAETHILMLCEDHISSDTWKLITKDKLPYSCMVGRVQYVWNNSNHYDYIIKFEEGIDLSELPADLRECILLAAKEGFNAITFEPADPDGMQPIDCLQVYD